MATDHNFRVKNGLEVGGVLIVNSSGQLQALQVSSHQHFLDNVEAKFGNSGDLKIYHNGSNQDRIDSSSSYLILEAHNHIFRKPGGSEDYAKFFGDGSVELYHNNSNQYLYDGFTHKKTVQCYQKYHRNIVKKDVHYSKLYRQRNVFKDDALQKRNRFLYYIGNLEKKQRQENMYMYPNLKYAKEVKGNQELSRRYHQLTDTIPKKYRSKPLSLNLHDRDSASKETNPQLILCKNRYNSRDGVILPINFRTRHMQHVKKDDIPWKDKKDAVVWRGVTTGKRDMKGGNRFVLCERWATSQDPRINIGFSKVKQRANVPQNHVKGNLSVNKMLAYKFVVSAPGNDKDSGLAWKLHSNSLVLMPKPLTHSWFMESELEPYVHYVPLKDDYSDLFEKVRWCKKNSNLVENILTNSTEWVNQFQDVEMDKVIVADIFESYYNY
mgnify:CR=1 FL=1